MEFIIIVLGIIADRVTKIAAAKALSGGNEVVIIKNLFSFSYVENVGAAFGIFANKQIILSIITLIILSLIIFYMYKSKIKSKFFRIGASLVIGGAIGNLIDRIYRGYVIDFILLHYKDVYSWPNFNVADICVVFGTISLAIYILKDVK
ncbi:signal peptidase II [Clostridium sp. 19966]|uniref:signal peptidase II n=1 Tax=Clostridium sp. 19966 TaxID=2768166 RepID=UPI0028E0001A|nr:signal peptidase II [Clostridium sp. 19966]MDT8716609.1 signal peptidase II [Clostridium sp. 19966]